MSGTAEYLTSTAVRRRLMLAEHGALLADVATVMNCDVELCADELAGTFRGDPVPYKRAILEEVERRFHVTTTWSGTELAAYRRLVGRDPLTPSPHPNCRCTLIG